MGDLPTPGQPMVFPTNFPDEAFWSMADSTVATNGSGGSAILVTGLEAAFAADVAPGQQISFGRIRLRVAGAGLQTGRPTRSPTRSVSTPTSPIRARQRRRRRARSTSPRTSATWPAARPSRPRWAAARRHSSSGTRPSPRRRRLVTSVTRPSTTKSPAARTTPTSSVSRAPPVRSPGHPTCAPTRRWATARQRPTTASRRTCSR